MLKNGWDLDRVVNRIVAEGVPCFSGSCSEIYLEQAFKKSGLGPAERLPVAKEPGETSLMFLVHPTLSEAVMHTAADVIEKVLSEASL